VRSETERRSNQTCVFKHEVQTIKTSWARIVTTSKKLKVYKYLSHFQIIMSREDQVIRMLRGQETWEVVDQAGIERGFGGVVTKVDGRKVTAHRMGGLPAEIDGQVVKYEFGMVPASVPKKRASRQGTVETTGTYSSRRGVENNLEHLQDKYFSNR